MPQGPNGEQRRRYDESPYNPMHVLGYSLAVLISVGGGWLGGTKLAQEETTPRVLEQTKLTRAEFLSWVTANTERIGRVEKTLDATVQYRELDPMIKRLDRIEKLLDELVRDRRERVQ